MSPPGGKGLRCSSVLCCRAGVSRCTSLSVRLSQSLFLSPPLPPQACRCHTLWRRVAPSRRVCVLLLLDVSLCLLEPVTHYRSAPISTPPPPPQRPVLCMLCCRAWHVHTTTLPFSPTTDSGRPGSREGDCVMTGRPRSVLPVIHVFHVTLIGRRELINSALCPLLLCSAGALV